MVFTLFLLGKYPGIYFLELIQVFTLFTQIPGYILCPKVYTFYLLAYSFYVNRSDVAARVELLGLRWTNKKRGGRRRQRCCVQLLPSGWSSLPDCCVVTTVAMASAHVLTDSTFVNNKSADSIGTDSVYSSIQSIARRREFICQQQLSSELSLIHI